MTPTIVIVGRANVGKSTLFNCLTKSRDALVADFVGLTRDRQYGQGRLGDKTYIVVDTGGLGAQEDINQQITAQVWQAIEEADIILFIVDGKAGLTSDDEEIARQLRSLKKPIHLIVNKTDGLDATIAISDFYKLGFGEPYPIAASHNKGVASLINMLLTDVIYAEETLATTQEAVIKIAIVGQPNAGKSTLINRILGEERLIVSPQPGTTRDSIFVPFKHKNNQYILIDTAGVRRRAKVKELVEKYSVIKTLQAIENANVVVLVIDALKNVVDQDLKLLDFIVTEGKALVIVVNKWDVVNSLQQQKVRAELARRANFIDFAQIFFISALNGSKVSAILPAVKKAFLSATKKVTTPAVNKILQKLITQHKPPLVKGRRIKLRYAHAGGRNPPRIIIHGNQVKSLPGSYIRYLEKSFRKHLKLIGTPIIIELKEGENPFAKGKGVGSQ